MQSAEFVAHCKSLNQKHFGGEAEMSPKGPFIRRNVRSYYGIAQKYADGWQIRIAWHTMDLPGWVRDYIICHELAHCVGDPKAMHPPGFWTLLRAAYPRTDEAEAYLRRQTRPGPSDWKETPAHWDLKRKYPVGTYVNYADGHGGDHVGTILRHSRKTMTISNDEDGGWWRIPWTIVELAIIDIL